MKPFSCIFFIVILSLSCSPQRKFENLSDDTIIFQIEKTSCMGTCPVYELAVYSDGTVYFNGKEHVEKVGTYLGKINTAQLTSLESLIQAKEVTSYSQNKTDKKLMDLPTTYYTIKVGGEMKTIQRYGDYPKAFKDLDEEVKTIIGTLKWKSIN